jgi:predicted transposase
MKNTLQLKLLVSHEQALKLLDLQKTFALACDEAALFVARSRSWHRVTLHHLAYRSMREKFPLLGSQMVCNAIHTVSKASKEIFQDPESRWAAVAKAGQPLPILKFANSTPVFFDKHTLTLKKNALSIFTLDGRMHIQINLSETIETKLRNEKLKELSLLRQKNMFYLRFVFSQDPEESLLIKPSVKVISANHQESLAV